MPKKIETKTRTYDEGLSIIKEVTKVITHDDGRVETKVTTFEVGKRSHHSDYWRSHYAEDDADVGSVQLTEEDYLRQKCMHEVARIANAFDDDIKLAYKTKENPANDPREKTVLLDPNTAIGEDELGQKVDILSGEILLGTALRKQSRGTRAAYVRHLRIAYDESAPDVDRAASLLYLAMEADAACEHIKREAPGFTEYAHSRARKYVSDVGSELLQDGFLTDEADPGYKFAALIREFDTFRSQPLDYGEFEGVLQNIVEQVRGLPDAKSRLEAARQLAYRYLIQQGGQIQMPEGGEGNGDQDGPQMPNEGKGRFDPNGKLTPGGDGDSPIDMELLMEMLSSADMMGKEDNTEQLPGGDDGSAIDGFNKPQNPSKILQEKLLDGQVDKIPVRLETNVRSRLSDGQARKLYELDCQDVRQVSEAIEEALEILNRPEACWDEYSLRNGEIDEGGLHKLVDDSDDVFYRVETLPRMRIQVSLVLDESGSMACYVSDEEGEVRRDRSETKLHGTGCELRRDGVARKLATAFAEGTKNINGVSLSIYGHAGPHPICRVYKYIDERTDESQFHRVAHITNRLHNYDGYAILTAGEQMMIDDGDYDRRIMFIISDGEPSVSSYTGEEAQKHITSVVRYLNECGVETYAIGVDNAFPPGRGQEMYGEDRVVILPSFDLSEVSAIISAFLEEISRS